MSDKNKSDADKQAIDMALDQLNQTMEVMQQIVRRLRRSVEQANQHVALEQRRQLTANADKATGSGGKEADGTVKNQEEVRVLH